MKGLRSVGRRRLLTSLVLAPLLSLPSPGRASCTQACQRLFECLPNKRSALQLGSASILPVQVRRRELDMLLRSLGGQAWVAQASAVALRQRIEAVVAEDMARGDLVLLPDGWILSLTEWRLGQLAPTRES